MGRFIAVERDDDSQVYDEQREEVVLFIMGEGHFHVACHFANTWNEMEEATVGDMDDWFQLEAPDV